MPKQKLNAKYLEIIEKLQNAEEQYSNRWMSYRRAYSSLKDEKREFADVGDLKTVKYVGDVIISNIRTALSEGSGVSQRLPVSPSKRVRTDSSNLDAKSLKGRKRMRKSVAEDSETEDTVPNPIELDMSSMRPITSQSSFGTPNLLQSPVVFQPVNLGFQFVFIDSNGLLVQQRDGAEVNIYANICWYKIRFLKTCMGHPIVNYLRFISKPSETGIVVEAWIQDKHIFEFDLHQATGISHPLFYPPTFSAPQIQNTNTRTHLAHSQSTEIIQQASSSLADLLNTEKKGKSRLGTLDPARTLEVDRSWNIHPSHEMSVFPNKNLNKDTQLSPVVQDTSSAEFCLVGTSAASNCISGQLPTPPATQPTTQQSTPAVRGDSAPCITTKNGKGKGKRSARGRTSEFTPTFSPTDEFDLELEKQSGSQPTVTAEDLVCTYANASADFIDNIADLTNDQLRFAEFEPIVFQPGSFEVILILDNREVKSRDERNYIFDSLKKRQISVEQRSLAIGDVSWIAKCRFLSGAAVNHECVLGHVLERKRLDDLCESIKDGRFHEQKFRLANSGLKVFYLVESHEAEKHKEVFGVQIDTARSSTQIVDGFVLKETSGVQASIDYLATMHKTIYQMYHNKPLYVIPPSLIKRHSYLALQKHLQRTKPDLQYMTSYDCFERLNNKSANLTTRDLFAQMLLCIKGVSAEKAAVIIQNFPTMRSLWEAFKASDITEAAHQTSRKPLKASEMLCRLDGEGRKHYGPTLSTNIYNLFRK